MGVYKKQNNIVRNRQFGQPGGRHSLSFRKNEKARLLKLHERILLYKAEDRKQYQPYQLIRRRPCANGSIPTRFVVRRIPILKEKGARLLSLGRTGLKFKILKDSKPISGYRIINLDRLKQHVVSITTHSCICSAAQELAAHGKPPVTLKYEKCKSGLFSIMLAVCEGCGEKFPMDSSDRLENGLYDINVRAVWGTMVSGGGARNLNEQLGTMNIPSMNSGMFSSIEEKIGSWWEEALKEEIAKAGAEEKRLAIEKGHFHEGVPAITVICDGGWSKRTHKHTYNAYGGVGVIFGAQTQKLLYIGVRNKYCLLCTRARNQGIEPHEHNCYKNWSESSQAMESDIILCGFLEAETTHGVRYTKIIADGDSSVYAQLQENVPIWGRAITKLECANHTCKCLRSNLEKLVLEKPKYKGKGKLTKINRVRLTTAIRCAIKMRSKDKNSKQLRKDIINSIYHVLWFHERCSDFCKKASDINTGTNINEADDNNYEDSFDDIFESQYEYWKLPSEKEMESSRYASKKNCSKEELKELIKDVQVYLNRIANKADKLIGNFTTNLCESWMAIRTKFDGGKVINRCGKGSWNARCYGGALRKNLGVAWSPITFKNVTKEQPGEHFLLSARKLTQMSKASRKYRAKPESKTIRRKRKLSDLRESSTKKAKLHYGSNLDDSPDVSNEKLEDLCQNFMEKKVKKSEADISLIETKNIDQSESDLWKSERRIRLTSSNFGKVMSRRTSNVSNCLVKNMLYQQFSGNINTIRGLAQEENTVIEYKNLKGDVQVIKTGLRICRTHNFLASSTDGIVKTETSTGLLEIKNFLQNNAYLIKEAVRKVPNFCLQSTNNNLSLKRNHPIYYQIQGQLNIFELEWCDFILRRTNPYDIHVERITRDRHLWNKEMLPKLESFYMNFILPELALPRYGTYTGIRQPKAPWVKQSSTTVTPKSGTSSTILNSDECPGPSSSHARKEENCQVKLSASTTSNRSRRAKSVKFVGRQILHQWVVDEKKKKKKWYSGTVLDVVSGDDNFVSKLDEERRCKAKDELNELNDKDNQIAVQTLRQWVLDQDWLKTPTDFAFLLRFLRVRKFSQLGARETLENYWKGRTNTPEWFRNIDPADEIMQEILRSGCYQCPKKCDKMGRRVFLLKFSMLTVDLIKRWTVDNFYKAYFLIYEWLLLDERVQVYGTVIVVDYTDITLPLLMAITNPEIASKSVPFYNKALPMRLKGILMYNEPVFIDVLMALFNPFLRQKIRDRFIMHGRSFVRIYEDVGMEVFPDEYLPDEYKGPSTISKEKIIGDMLDDMMKPEFREYIKDLSSDKYGVDKVKRKHDDQPAESFRKLNVS